MLYEQIFRALHQAQIDYLIVGAVALNLHGIPRMTADLDVMVDLKEENLRKFVETMTNLGYRPRVPVQPAEFLDPAKRREWQDTKSMVVFTWIHPNRPYEEIDVFLENPIPFQQAFGLKKTLQIIDFTVPVANAQALIEMKERAGREQDRSDIAALRQLMKLEEGGS